MGIRGSRSLLVGAVAGALVLATTTLASAGGHGGPAEPVLRSSELGAPFNLDLATNNVPVADGALNTVGALRKDGSIKTVVKDAVGTAGVATAKGGKYLAHTTTDEGQAGITASGLTVLGPHGSTVKADTLAFERAKNPDQINTYGVTGYPVNADRECIDGFISDLTEGFVTYQGQVDSHAYSVVAYQKGWVVADAGAIALFRVDRRGRVSTLAVLPPQPLLITDEMAASPELPDCLGGVTYSFEPVPTDVEVGRDGALYLTTLPGGDGAALGARGALWRLSAGGKLKQLAGGFAGATNLAIGGDGEIYVAELFGDQISVVRHGRKSAFAALTGAVSVEVSPRGTLWAGTVSLQGDPGTIVEYRSGHFVKRWSAKR